MAVKQETLQPASELQAVRPDGMSKSGAKRVGDLFT